MRIRDSNRGHSSLCTATVRAAVVDASLRSAGTGSWPRGSRSGWGHAELIHQHGGKGVLGIRIKCTKGSIGREQGCGSPVRRVSPSTINAEREDRVPWVILLTARC